MFFGFSLRYAKSCFRRQCCLPFCAPFVFVLFFFYGMCVCVLCFRNFNPNHRSHSWHFQRIEQAAGSRQGTECVRFSVPFFQARKVGFPSYAALLVSIFYVEKPFPGQRGVSMVTRSTTEPLNRNRRLSLEPFDRSFDLTQATRSYALAPRIGRSTAVLLHSAAGHRSMCGSDGRSKGYQVSRGCAASNLIPFCDDSRTPASRRFLSFEIAFSRASGIVLHCGTGHPLSIVSWG